MKKIFNFLLTFMGILCLSTGAFAADLKVGFVYVGPPETSVGLTSMIKEGKAIERAFW